MSLQKKHNNLGYTSDKYDLYNQRQGEGNSGLCARNQARFLECFATCGMVSMASRWAKISRIRHNVWMREDPTYPARFKAAEDRFARAIEDIAVQVSVHGVEVPVLYKGKQVYLQGRPLVEVNRSERILEKLLKASNPEKFGDKMEIKNLRDMRPEDLTPEMLELITKHLIDQATNGDPDKVAEIHRLAAIEAGIMDAGAVVVDAKSEPVPEFASEPSTEAYT